MQRKKIVGNLFQYVAFAILCFIISIATQHSFSEQEGTAVPEYGMISGNNVFLYEVNPARNNGIDLVKYELGLQATKRIFRIPLRESNQFPIKWRIWGDHIWGLRGGYALPNTPQYQIARIPFQNLEKYDAIKIREEYKPPARLKTFPEGIAEAMPEFQLVNYALGCGPLQQMHGHVLYKFLEGPFHYGFLPVTDKVCRVFALVKDRIHVWEYSPEVDPESGFWKGPFVEKESMASSFAEPFRVFLDGDGYLFLTNSGTIYGTTRDEEGTLKTVEVWNRQDEPV